MWYTGTSRHWEAIRDANPTLDVRRIKLGQVIQIPLQFVKSQKPLTPKAVGEIQAKIDGAPQDAALTWREADDANYNYPVRTIQGCEELPNSLVGLHECANRVGRTLKVRTVSSF